jgi:DNA topoisomerase-2
METHKNIKKDKEKMSSIQINIRKPTLQISSALKKEDNEKKDEAKKISLNIFSEKKDEPKKISLNVSNQTTFEKKDEPKKISLKISGSSSSSPQKVGKMSATDFKKYDDQRDHMYDKPSMYCGSDKKTEREERVLNLETQKFENIIITLPQVVECVFNEIISNSADNVTRSLKAGVEPGIIDVKMDKHYITIRNGGIPIPIEIHPEWNTYIPETIFGTLLSSSHYDKTKSTTEIGTNGVGSKVSNVFSLQFTVNIGDPNNQKLYKQTWKNNMRERGEPQISHYSKDSPPFVEVNYYLDFPRFQYTEYPEEAFKLFARQCCDIAFTLKTPVVFNGHKFNISSAKDYAKLYFNEEKIKSSIIYMSWPQGTEIIKKKNVDYAKDKRILPVVEICAVDSPDEAIRVSFVNGKYTPNNGVHYEAAFKAVATGVLKTVNESGDNKKAKKKGEKTLKLNLGDVKRHISIFVSCWLPNPDFDAQTKNELKSPIPKIDIPDEVLKPILRWEVLDRLYAEMEAKLFRTTIKTDGKKKRHINDNEKLHDANYAASNKSKDCTLYLTEGDSALTFAIKMCGYMGEKARDYIGTMSLGGKLLNVRNATITKIFANKIINQIKQALGLRTGTDYGNEENFNSLRYGRVVLLADSDNDGKHIIALIENFFDVEFPSLLKRGYVFFMRTKILEAIKGKNKVKFYTVHEFEEWKRSTPDWKSWSMSYFKGLATSKDLDIKEETVNPRLVLSHYDEFAPYSLKLAFDQSLSNQRKIWIENFQFDPKVETMQVQPISLFINHELIQFSIANLLRTIPQFTDGLKESQRKILYASMLRWKGDKKEKMKVSQLASYVSEKTNYHYGERSLEMAIVALAQDFVGSNNLPYFQREGQFGSRYGNPEGPGKDSGSSRYIFVLPEIYFPYIFRKEDKPILELRCEEGEEIEPKFLLPIIPLHLINGVTAIASAYSSNCVSHNPLDCVYWIQSKIMGCPLTEIKPWYRYFEGTIELKKKGKRSDKEESDESQETSQEYSEQFLEEKDFEEEKEEGEENRENIEKEIIDREEVFVNKHTKLSMVTKGKFEKQGKKVIVTEIPVGKGIQQYEKQLKIMREEKIIKDFKDYSTADNPKFEITGMENPSFKNLKLIKTFGMSNMVFLDSNNKPVKYETVNDILESFYSIRLAYYHKRKEYILVDIQDKISLLKMKMNFIIAVIKGYKLSQENKEITIEEANKLGAILVVERSKQKLLEQMEFFKFDSELAKKTSVYSLTEEEIEKARQDVIDLEKEYENIKDTKPEEFWLDDLNDFVKIYCKHYKCDYKPPKKLSLNISSK